MSDVNKTRRGLTILVSAVLILGTLYYLIGLYLLTLGFIFAVLALPFLFIAFFRKRSQRSHDRP